MIYNKIAIIVAVVLASCIASAQDCFGAGGLGGVNCDGSTLCCGPYSSNPVCIPADNTGGMCYVVGYAVLCCVLLCLAYVSGICTYPSL